MQKKKQTILRLIIASFLFVGIGCGNPPTTTSDGQRVPPRDSPVPTPTRSIVSGSLSDDEMAEMLPDYSLTRAGGNWIQLQHRVNQEITIVVGVEMGLSGADLDSQIEDHRESIHYPPRNQHRGSGHTELPFLGNATWSWGSLDIGEDPIDEIALFAFHPVFEALLIARYEGPSENDEVQPELDELLRVADIVAQGL